MSHYEYNDPHIRHIISWYVANKEVNPELATSIMTNRDE
jgi:hypothetical protein